MLSLVLTLALLVIATTFWLRRAQSSTRGKLCEAPAPLQEDSNAPPLMTLSELSHFVGPDGSGQGEDAIYVSVDGVVYDVSQETKLYGCCGAYAVMAGHDASRMLALGSMQQALLNAPIDDLTAHQMRKLQDYKSIYQRKYKVVGRVLLPKSSQQATPNSTSATTCTAPAIHIPASFTMEEIRLSSRRLVALKGIVYDTSADDDLFLRGKFAAFVGHDCTAALGRGRIDETLLDCAIDCLSFEQLKIVEAFAQAFDLRYPRVGVLADGPTSDLNSSSAAFSEQHSNLHRAIEDGDVALLKSLLKAADNANVNEICPRSRLTPLHKAIEVNNLEMVKILVEAGADDKAAASLYDDATPVQLAKLFGCRSIRDVLAAM